jgi:hypothetical protein
VNKKKQKNFMTALRAKNFMTALRAKNFMTALRALGGWRLCPLRPPDVARRMKFFARFFSKKRRLLADTCMLMTVRTRRSSDQQIRR